MKLPRLKIRNLEVEFPIIQAGMGVHIANAELSSATINQGGFGTIASVGLGDPERSRSNFVEESNRVLTEEITKARELSNGKQALGVNIMVAISNYEDIARTSVAAGVDFIISGAGLPLPLPEYVGDADVALIPVVSSGRALQIILKTWQRKYNRKPDAIVVEGPKCGGHLGFSLEQLDDQDAYSLASLLDECKTVMEKFEVAVPLIAAGEITTRADIEDCLKMGFDGVQIGTRFIATDEAGLDAKSKEVFVNATADDVVIIKSPVGLPVRVLKTPLVERVLAGKREKFGCPYHCLRTCNPAKAPFCIANALIATYKGDVGNGLYMTGSSIDKVNDIISMSQFFDTLKN